MTTATPSAPTRAQLEQQIAEYLAAFWPSLPPQHIQMQTRGAKYKWVKTEPKEGEQEGEHIPLDQATLLAHAAGRRTIGAYLQDATDRARIGMIDVDDGGRAALVRCLLAAEQLGLVAYAIVMPGEPHDGGRLVVAYKEFASTNAIRAQMLAIVKLAGLPENTEIWPCSQAVALPFAYHLRKRTRGELVLQTGESIALDTDLVASFAAVRALPLNGAPPAVEPPAPAERPAAAARPAAAKHTSQAQPRRASAGQRASLDDVKAEFNTKNQLPDLLAGYGAVQTSSKDYTCPFCKHSHTNTLFIYNGRIYSRSPGCIVPQKRGLDPFGLYCLVEHNNDPIAAVKKLNPIAPRKARQEAPPLVEQPARKPQTPEQAAEAQRKREARAATAAEIRASVELAASQDDRLSDSAQLVLMALLDVAGDRAWCRPSVARIEEMTSLCRRAVFYGLAELERREYIRSSNAPGRTTVRTFLRVQADQPILGALHPDLNIQDLLPLTRGANERAPHPPATVEPAEWECWQPAEPDYDFAPEPEQPALVELPAGWRIVRPARGPWCWAATAGAMTATHPRDTSDQVLIAAAWLKAATLAEVRAVEPAQPEPEQAQTRPSLAPQEAAQLESTAEQRLVEPVAIAIGYSKPDQEAADDEYLATYSPPAVEPSGAYTGCVKDSQGFAEQWAAATSAIKVRAAPADAPEAPRHAEQEEPLVRAAPVEPAAAARYWSLKGKLRKATSTKQIAWLRRQIADLEIWRPASELAVSRAGVGDARPSQARRAAGPPPSQAQQALLFGGAD